MHIDREVMGPHFTKFHIRGEWPFHPVFHRFSATDGGLPHCHPWSFRTFIISGGYVEEIYNLETGFVEERFNKPGDSLFIPATHIHRIIELPEGECWTLILPQPGPPRDPRFYDFRPDGTFSRVCHHHDQPFMPHYG